MAAKHARPVAIDVAAQIRMVGGRRVLLDSDIASLYGVTVKRLNQQVRRNLSRFPDDFVVRLTNQDLANLKLQFESSSLRQAGWGGRRKQTLAFTEHGAIMAATILNSARAEQMSVYVVRAFVKMRESLLVNAVLARDLAALKTRVDSLDVDTQKQFAQVFEAILGMTHAPTGRQ